MDKMDWTKTKAVWDGEDWQFTEVPGNACWDGRTCFNRTELNYNGDDPVKAVDALMYWCEYGESQPDEVISKKTIRRYEMKNEEIKVVEEAILVCYKKVLYSEASDNLEPMAQAHYELALNFIAQAAAYMNLAGLTQGESKC